MFFSSPYLLGSRHRQKDWPSACLGSAFRRQFLDLHPALASPGTERYERHLQGPSWLATLSLMFTAGLVRQSRVEHYPTETSFLERLECSPLKLTEKGRETRPTKALRKLRSIKEAQHLVFEAAVTFLEY
jgi:hypothetical protein